MTTEEPDSGQAGNTPSRQSRQKNVSAALPIREMPLFPLDVVLFPFMVLPLHIFEERYKTMIDRCVHNSEPFGIVLSEDDTSKIAPSAPIVGCAARIARVERLPDGRMNIEVVGEDRFRVLDTHEQLPYRTGLTELFEDVPEDAHRTVELAAEVQRLLRDFLTRSFAVKGQTVPEFSLPNDPQQLSFTAAWALPVELPEKQALLAEDSVVARLTIEREALLREVTRLRRAAESQQAFWRPLSSDMFADYVCAN